MMGSMDTNDSLNTALVVADEKGSVLPAVTSLLEKAGFAVVTAPNAPAAIGRCRLERPPIDLAVIDAADASMTPAEIIRQLQDVCPRARLLFLCDDQTELPHEAASADQVRSFLRKPFRRAQFLGQVLEMMDKPRVMTA